MDIQRIVPGQGGDCLLIRDEKSALWDTGQYYCGKNCVRLIKDALAGEKLAYIVLSHSHYDHVGALGILRRAFPEAEVIASDYCAYVLKREGARKVMEEMAVTAASTFMDDPSVLEQPDFSDFAADRTVSTGDTIDLGQAHFRVYNTPGHTKCCISLFDETSGTLISSESSGVLSDYGWCHLPILTGAEDCFRSVALCRSLEVKELYVPHHGHVMPEDGFTPATFFERVLECAGIMKEMLVDCVRRGLSDEETLDYLTVNIHDRYIVSEGQPVKAFQLNTAGYIKTMRREFPELFEH